MYTLQGNDCVWLVSKLLLTAEHLLDLCRLDLLYPGLTSPDAFKQLKPIPRRLLLVFYTHRAVWIERKHHHFAKIKLDYILYRNRMQHSLLPKTCRSGLTCQEVFALN